MLVAVLYRVRPHEFSLVVTRPLQQGEGGRALTREMKFTAQTKEKAIAQANRLITPHKSVQSEKVVRIFVEGDGRIHGGIRGGDYWADKKATYNGPASIDAYRRTLGI
jgi:hypothetical protein